jgi:hypothetical protein
MGDPRRSMDDPGIMSINRPVCVCRLVILGELLPLVSHLSQTHLELHAWLCDVRADVDSLDLTGGESDVGGDRAEQLRIHQYNIKVTTVVQHCYPVLSTQFADLNRFCAPAGISRFIRVVRFFPQKRSVGTVLTTWSDALPYINEVGAPCSAPFCGRQILSHTMLFCVTNELISWGNSTCHSV